MATLIHYTSSYFKRSIMSEGLTWKHRNIDDPEGGKIYTDTLNKILNKYKPKDEYPSNLINRDDCLFFTLKEDKIVSDGLRDLKIEVDSNTLIKEKLFAAPFPLADLLEAGLINSYPLDKMKVIAEHYWNNSFPLHDYLKHKKVIKSAFRALWNIEYIPEIIYMNEVPRELLK